MNRLAPALLTLLLGLAVPASASAAERFAGVLEDGRLVTFTHPDPYPLSAPLTPRGLAGGERLVALADGPRGTVGVGSSAQLYSVDPERGRVRPIGPPFRQGLRGSRFSLAVAPGGTTGRLVSDVGQDLIVDLVTGATADGPGLRRADDGSVIRPAVDFRADGRLAGVALSPPTLFTEIAPGLSAFTATSLTAPPRQPIGEPVGLQLAGDGIGYVLGVASDRRRARQSLLLRFDADTGQPVGGSDRSADYLSRRLTTFASLGTAPADRTAPRVSARLPRKVSARRVLARRFPLVLRCSEACQVTVSLRIRGERAGFGFASRDTPGVLSLEQLFVQGAERRRVREGVGVRIRVIMGANDFKGNRRTVVRTARLVR